MQVVAVYYLQLPAEQASHWLSQQLGMDTGMVSRRDSAVSNEVICIVLCMFAVFLVKLVKLKLD